ncbi:MAG: helix-turn-helix transcriptional regulator [Devosia sp.]|nr:helix-turn-helix transcriptional regulator [Devosia sp.]
MLGGLALGVAFDLTDPALEQVLRDRVAQRTDLFEADAGEAAVTITDRPAALGGAIDTHRVLRIGADEARRNAIDSLDPALVLAAATLIGAGYALERDAGEARPRSNASFPALSQRERQVAELLVDGASNKVIARALDISVHTAKFHVTAILDKLGARNRADAVSIILREGLVLV